MTRYGQKAEIFLVTILLTCWKPNSCFWFVRMDKKGDKSEFVTESVGIIVTIYFHVKILLKLVVKP